jgi:hypothetical protein
MKECLFAKRQAPPFPTCMMTLAIFLGRGWCRFVFRLFGVVKGGGEGFGLLLHFWTLHRLILCQVGFKLIHLFLVILLQGFKLFLQFQPFLSLAINLRLLLLTI